MELECSYDQQLRCECKSLPRATKESALNLLKKESGHQFNETAVEQVVIIKEQDFPVSLVGQLGVRAKRDIKCGETIAIYEGEYRHERISNPYIVIVISDQPHPEDDRWIKDPEFGLPPHYILYRLDPTNDKKKSNLSMRINDFRTDTTKPSDRKVNDSSRVNVDLIFSTLTIDIVQYPVVLVVATNNITKGNHLWMDYGDSYWKRQM